ncbi:MAG: ribosome silencing factor [Flavobacteriia bacterium]|nr:ribosome silencing factor [Flavobacteriia bacterium]
MRKKTDSKTLIDNIIDSIQSIKGEDIVVLDLTGIENTFCEYFVLCTGNSNTHAASIAATVERKVRENSGEKPWHTEGIENAQWILMDYTTVIVHIFQREYREFYDLESLWGDARQISITD